MIIKSSRLQSRVGAKSTAAHVFEGPQNEEITVLRGSRHDLHDWVRDARKRKKEFAIRHWKLSPERDITPEQEAEAVAALAVEFGFDAERVVLIRHRKARHGGEASEFHLHLLVPEVNPLTGRTLSTKWDYARHEKVSRSLELAWGHRLVPGRFNAPVVAALEAEGRHVDASHVALGTASETRPESAYTSQLVQEVARKTKRTMAKIRDAVLDARALSGGDVSEFHRIMEQDGLRVVRGDKAARWVIEARAKGGDWTFAGALHRLAGMKAIEADQWMLGKLTTPHTPTRGCFLPEAGTTGRDYNDNDRPDTPEFRQEMARELLSRGIEVEDCPLDPREVAEITDRVSARGMAVEPNQSVGTRYGAGALA